MNESQIHEYKLASKGKRLLAFLIESLILTPVSIGIHLIFGQSISEYWSSDFELVEIIYSAISGLIFGAIFYPLFAGNIGHRIFNLKVISTESGEDYNKAEKGAIRECLKHVLGFLFLPLIWILWDNKNQNLYDKLTKTTVVER